MERAGGRQAGLSLSQAEMKDHATSQWAINQHAQYEIKIWRWAIDGPVAPSRAEGPHKNEAKLDIKEQYMHRNQSKDEQRVRLSGSRFVFFRMCMET